MSENSICIHGLEDIQSYDLAGYHVVARTQSREELRQALTAVKPHVLVLDLDVPDACETIVEATETLGGLGIVGVTDSQNPQTLVAAVRAGCRQLATKPLDANDLVVAIRRVLNESAGQHENGRVYGVIGASGGSGATTVACHLAHAIVEISEGATLAVDLDFEFGGVARAWDLAPSYTIADIASAGAVDAALLKKAVCETPRGLAVLARPARIEEGHTIDEILVSAVIGCARTIYPNVVLDLPRKLDAVAGAAIQRCDKLLIVAQSTVPAVDNARRLSEALARAGISPDNIEFVLNRYRKSAQNVTLELIEKTLGKKLFGLIPSDFKSVAHALDLGQPITGRNEVYRAISQIARNLTGQVETQSSGGWFGMFGSRKKAKVS